MAHPVAVSSKDSLGHRELMEPPLVPQNLRGHCSPGASWTKLDRPFIAETWA